MELKKFTVIISVFFLLVFFEIAIMKLKEEVSLIRILEIGSFGLFILLYYFIVRAEVRFASNIIEERLKRIEKEFEKIEERLREEVQVLKSEVSELKTLLKKDVRKKQ